MVRTPITVLPGYDLGHITQPARSIISKHTLDQDREAVLEEATQIVDVAAEVLVDDLARRRPPGPYLISAHPSRRRLECSPGSISSGHGSETIFHAICHVCHVDYRSKLIKASAAVAA